MLTSGGFGGVGGAGGGGGGTFTVTRAVSVASPPGPVALAVYVTDDVGFTMRLPVAITAPTPGSIWTFAAFRASHAKVTGCPRSTVAGFARSVIVGAGAATGGGGGGGGGGWTTAAFFLHENVNSINRKRSNNPRFLMRNVVIAGPPCSY